jgi:undecaprenyl-diphosphatase
MILVAIKYIVKRHRPFRDDKKIKNEDVMDLDYFSFPSGHAFNAFLLYYILIENNVINSYYQIIPYMVALSRVVLGVHYPTDVFGGFLLAKIIFNLSK